MPETSQVNCGSCRLCCKGDSIILHEGHDNPNNYETVEILSPITGKPTLILAHKENGDCIYLGENGCTIYEKRPMICREFDCRKFASCVPHKYREALIRNGKIRRLVVNAGQKRAHTLTHDEQQACEARRHDLAQQMKEKRNENNIS